ncbi:MAG TPA: hypothetical protein VGO47_12200 [Chlamydiales bacterium]|nr:hypothetical protein [Chlamydiales bacterium]
MASELTTDLDIATYTAIADGSIPLVIHVSSADIIASVLRLKQEVEEARHVRLRLTLVGAEEAHLLAREIADADVGVILVPVRPFPKTWAARRMYLMSLFLWEGECYLVHTATI